MNSVAKVDSVFCLIYSFFLDFIHDRLSGAKQV